MDHRKHCKEAFEAIATTDVVRLECQIVKIGLGAARMCGLMDEYENALMRAAGAERTKTFSKVA